MPLTLTGKIVKSELARMAQFAPDSRERLRGKGFHGGIVFSDCLPTQLCLLLQGSAHIEATGLLRVLNWFCRHPLLLLDDAGIDQLPSRHTPR
jgi:hypothetical protein